MKKTSKVSDEMLYNNTKTIILLNCLIVILVLISIGLCYYTLNYVKNNTVQTQTEEEQNEYDVSMFTSIDTDKFVELFERDKQSFIYLGRSTCGFFFFFLPNLQKAQEEYGYKTYYLDITTVDDTGMKKIQKLDKFLKDNYGYTPMVLVVRNGKILNKEVNNYNGVGYTEYNTLEKFLKKLNYEKK